MQPFKAHNKAAQINIRPEVPADFEKIREITLLAFSGKPYAAGDEHELIDELRSQGALTLSLVAELSAEVVGQITFSPAYPADGTANWYALGPVSVLPHHQLSGIGSALINTGLKAIESLGAGGCVLTGNPQYYHRFGFAASPAHVPDNESEAFFMAKAFGTVLPAGPIHFHGAFYGDA